MPRGGARYDKKGNLLTGRPKMDPAKKRQTYNTRLKPEIIEYLRLQDNAARFLETLVEVYIKCEADALKV